MTKSGEGGFTALAQLTMAIFRDNSKDNVTSWDIP